MHAQHPPLDEEVLRKEDLHPDPIAEFRLWFERAASSEADDAHAMVLATATPDGQPSARVVLLKEVDARGFTFFTNYESRKGRELERNPRAALVFFWRDLQRQVRVEGEVERVPREESARYFDTRPRESQIGAWASRQSEVLAGRPELVERFAEAERRFAGADVPLPETWGGFRLIPRVMEFWAGRSGRLHDRFRYTRTAERWLLERLYP